MSDYALEMQHIRKRFGGNLALDDVDFRVRRGEVHALCGENGAGKSTLMKILSGVYPHGDYEGELLLYCRPVAFAGRSHSRRAGIEIVYQELEEIPDMTVADNIFLGQEPLRRGLVDHDTMRRNTMALLRRVRLEVSPEAKMRRLGIGAKQLVAVAKALAADPRIVIFDEPTAALTTGDAETLLNLVDELRRDGVTCVYISHRLNEVLRIADTITVLRDGRTVATAPASQMSVGTLIRHMVGRELNQQFPARTPVAGDVVLRVRNLTSVNPRTGRTIIADINFDLRRGEILGVAGLMGAGRTELAMTIVGALPMHSGLIEIGGKRLNNRSPAEAICQGVFLAVEDRKTGGLVLCHSVLRNMSLASLAAICRRGLVDERREIARANQQVSALRIRTSSLEILAGALSGGNQQKIVLAKALLTEPQVLILDEPTRGIDVGAKQEIYAIMTELTRKGVSIIMISSELQELLGMSDRILVMRGGRPTGELKGAEATQEKIMQLATIAEAA